MNKKTLFTLITILFFVGIAAYIVFVYLPYQKDYALYKDTFMSKQKMQNDFYYVWDFIENGYPFKNVCIRAGADLKAIKEEYANRLHEPKNEFEYYLFYSSLFNKITSKKEIGHLSVYNINLLKPYTNKVQYTKVYDNDEQVNKFYSHVIDIMFKSLDNQNIKELAEKYNLDIDTDKRSFVEADFDMIASRIIVKNKIGYINIKSFFPYGVDKYTERLVKILKSFETFEHLIIDLRGNNGGYSEIWQNFIVAPIVKRQLVYYSTAVFNSTNKFIKILNSRLKFKLEKSILGEYSEVKFHIINEKDKNDFDSIVEYVHRIKLSEHKVFFTGKIWLLIDRDTISAASHFAYYSKLMSTGIFKEFATVVGENTGGQGLNGFPSMRLYLKLPESHMLIQSDMTYGLNPDGSCHDETGTAPDIYNLPGKDALETCLETIKNLEQKN
ncbi:MULTISPECIES: S41 family peptidase [unclassified Treponema]|uniref:S41 family peptidase n=1 Tax=unclassified Treponema TaxID=2638727 RepID=UPI0020A2408E|nr:MULTISPECIES: S41 family peptidase [unclassified Treponema]UTC67203.1 hypothetical protein E4O06_00575 [Treponema sp. OMZ 789]UTC69932.1 hypothetical protein E4O01_00570 [Treponema sp. OMZ 790]UTC72647.1 hypothetical protein E4O02_00570 [Treponema sp. OMZ 791]